jgi:dCMP deaminase
MSNLFYLSLAGQYAKQATGCTKVSVGSCIVKHGNIIAMGANRALPNSCRSHRGCLRIEKYGTNSKLHRNPEDCRAIHSEVDAIGKAAKCGVSTEGATIYVTRYPCEACARLIVASGISKVVYGRQQVISETTEQIFKDAWVDCVNYSEYMEDDTVE